MRNRPPRPLAQHSNSRSRLPIEQRCLECSDLSGTAAGSDAEYFGKEILGSVQGVVQMVTNGGAALGPLCLVTLMRITGLHITRIFQCYAMLSGAGFVFAALCGGRPTPKG